MTKKRSSFFLVMAVVLVLLATPLLWPLSPWLVRALALAILGLVTVVQWRKGNRLVLSSALFVLPSLILVFYSIAGAMMVETLGGATPIHDPAEYAAEYARRTQWDNLYLFRNIRLAYGSQAELMTVQFTLGLLAILAAASGVPRPAVKAPPVPGSMEIVVLLGLGAGTAACARIAAALDLWGHQFAFALLPLAAFAMAQAARYWAAGLRGGGLLFVAMVLVAWIGFFGQGLKPLALMLPSCLILVASHLHFKRRQVFVLLGALAILSFASLNLMGLARGNYATTDLVNGLGRLIRDKVISRQAETMFCLTSAANSASLASARNHNTMDPGFIFGILVPRTLWQDKPNYSMGGIYAVDYCLNSAYDQARSRHSASVTLLGEPLLHGGRPMLVLFTGVIAAILAMLARASERGPPALATSILAMTGWMVDFDQHSTLYLGNAVKVALCLIGPGLLFHWLSARTARPSDPGPAPGS